MSDTLIAYIRTYVPIAVGSVLSWLFVTYGVVVSDDIKSAAAVGLTGIVIALYYALVNLLTKLNPFFGNLLGVKKKPTYTQ